MGAGALTVKSDCPRTVLLCLLMDHLACTRSQVCTHEGYRFCNLEPRVLDGSHGRTTLVPPICGHQSIPLHLPPMCLSLPGSRCNYKNLVLSSKHRASCPMQFLKSEVFPAILNVHSSVRDPSLRVSSEGQLRRDAGCG